MKLVIVSGGFDPLHKGHMRYIQEASKHGDVLVLLNSDDWLLRKKGYKFMDWHERAEILKGVKGVKWVYPVDDFDGTVSKGINEVYNTFKNIYSEIFFAKGGDRNPENVKEKHLCEDIGVQLIWECGGPDKVQASSELVKNVRIYNA